MVKSPAAVEEGEPTFRIGAVCRLTGLSQHVLRVWERRYGAVDPVRSDTDRRLYRQRDIDRLVLLKTLVDRGQAIGSIASLDDAELQRRLQQSADSMKRNSTIEKPELMLIGESLHSARDDCAASDIFTLSGYFTDIAALGANSSSRRLDVAVVEWPSLQPDAAIEVIRLANQLNVRHLVLLYDYAPRAALQRLANERVTALRSPLDVTALEAVIAWRFGIVADRGEAFDDLPDIAPKRQYNNRELSFLATQTSAIDCECPMHLAQLITRLVNFETYSSECESRDARDAALHSYLHKTTSQARSMMERALTRVVELENLSVPPENP